MDDLAIKKDVEAELQYEPSINAAVIGVAVKEGIVTLTGRVTTLSEKYAAARAAARVAGVKAVANEIEVGLLPADQRSDEEIARAVANALTWNTSIPPDRVKAQFEGAAIFGVSLAMMGEITAQSGKIVQSNFHNYPVARLKQSPKNIHVTIVDSRAPHAGVGEPGAPVMAPAITAAIFNATGKRIRELPVKKTKLV